MKVLKEVKIVLFSVVIVIIASISLFFATMREAPKTGPDHVRLQDIRRLQTLLEIYKNEKGQFPNELNGLYQTYQTTIPTPPKELTSKLCTNENNQYVYKKNKNDFYVLTFCIGEEGGYQGGVHIATPNGIY